MKRYLFLILLSIISYSVFSQAFSDDFNGIDSIKRNVVDPGLILDFYNDGDSVLYIMGGISYVNNVPVKAIFSWNGDSIKIYSENLNTGGAAPSCIYKYKDTLYLGFSSYNFDYPEMKYLMLWNGSSWQSCRVGQPNGFLYDICKFDNKLWVCGSFGTLGSVPCDMVGYYDGTSWNAAGSFGMYARALQVFNGELYAGGYWGLRRYLGGTSWETFTINPNGYVNDMAVDTFNTFLYVGGQFMTIGTQRSVGCGMWDGFKWTYMDYIYGSTVWDKAMAVYQGDLYTAHSYMVHEDQSNEFSVMRWDGQQWDSLGGNFSSSIMALEVFRDELYIGTGSFTYDGQRSKGMRKMSFPDNGCDYIKPRINTLVDTFYIYDGIEDGEYNRTAEAQFYNNNPYVDSWSWDFGDGNSSGIKDPVNYYTAPGEYGVTVTVSHEGCERSYTKTIYVKAGNVGIEGNEIIGFSIFPNPAEDSFTIQAAMDNFDNVELRIHGLNGHLKAIVPVNSSETVINTDNWSPGTYICNLFVDGKLVRTERVLVR